MLAEALQDEPAWREILRIENIEFPTARATMRPCGTDANETRTRARVVGKF
jgi:hypothetical protein